MERKIMKIKSLKIEDLHGYINYYVKFNDDLTFLYGDNGCGKTTILNIITYIITGQIFELFKFKFNSIILEYYDDKICNKIKIFKNDEYIRIIFGNSEDKLIYQPFDFSSKRAEGYENKARYYFSEHQILSDIRKTFNYMYLPLSRNGNYTNNDVLDHKERIQVSHRYNYTNNIDSTLYDVEMLIKNSYNKVNFILNKINETFSDDILKSFLDVENISNFDQVFNYINELDGNKINDIQKQYTDVLITLKKWDNETESKISSFFDSLKHDVVTLKKDGPDATILIETLFKISELIKITRIIEQAESLEKAKDRYKQPLDMFIKIINGFIYSGVSRKEVDIDDDGNLYIKSPHHKKLNIQQLSSGEKQIVTFFAYLIFGLEKSNQSIFIVDEPELSLHLNWQRMFIDSILSVNQNVQLIFATHAPEIIGKHRDKSVKLIPNI